MKQALMLFIGVLLCGCTNLSDKKIEQPWVISTIDINEAAFVRDVLKKDMPADNFYVLAGSTTTTVHFKAPSKPANEIALRESMRQIKGILSEHRGRTANTLRFIFPEVTLEE
jgi:hypothetical protein